MNNLKRLQDITQQIQLFRKVLIISWPFIKNLMENHDWEHDAYLVDDWIQVNWELLVERELLGRYKWLTPLSSSDYRVLNQKTIAQYSVTTLLEDDLADLRTGETLPRQHHLRVVGFCTSLERGKYGLHPPFDAVHLIDDSEKSKKVLTASFAGRSFFLKALNVGRYTY